MPSLHALPRADSLRCCKQNETRNTAGLLDLDQRGDRAATLVGNPSETVIQEGPAMPEKIDDLIPTAREIQKQAALKEAEKADQDTRRLAAAEAEKHALIERLSKPSGLTEDEKVKLAATVIQRAVRNGLTEVQVYRFPNSLCTDKGRAINQQERGVGKNAYGNGSGNLSALV
jgi:hypothetical protein